MMRRLLIDMDENRFHQHHGLNNESGSMAATNSTANSSHSSSSGSTSSSGGGCNSKQTINAGDNPCPTVQSPLPYMLAGLAAMVLLVVISLLILACSYLRGYFAMEQQQQQQQQQQQNNQQEGQQPSSSSAGSKAATLHSAHATGGIVDDKILVILPGEAKPTHLAQPVRVLLAAAAAISGQQAHSRSASPARPGVELVVVPSSGV